MKQWIPVWHQAVTESFNKGKAFGKDKTITFTVHSPVDADQVRIRFSNMLGQEPCQIDAISIINEYSRMPVKLRSLSLQDRKYIRIRSIFLFRKIQRLPSVCITQVIFWIAI